VECSGVVTLRGRITPRSAESIAIAYTLENSRKEAS